ncbi:hypothetical protein NUH87_31100 [Pseudomonas batumici]|uniref:hypothetical protein n=1 Tax=Pseudomonas batumici TaxID=226910 RepID=UPI0030CDC29C
MKGISGIDGSSVGVVLGGMAVIIQSSVANALLAVSNSNRQQVVKEEPYISPTVMMALGVGGLFAAGFAAYRYLSPLPPVRPRGNRHYAASSGAKKKTPKTTQPLTPSKKNRLVTSEDQLIKRTHVQWKVIPLSDKKYIIQHVTDRYLSLEVTPWSKDRLSQLYEFNRLLKMNTPGETLEQFISNHTIDFETVKKATEDSNPEPKLLLNLTPLWTPEQVEIAEQDITAIQLPNTPSATTENTPSTQGTTSKRKHQSTVPTSSPARTSARPEKPQRKIFMTPLFNEQYKLFTRGDQARSDRLDKFLADARFRSMPGGHAHRVGEWLSVDFNPEKEKGRGKWRILYKLDSGKVSIYGVVDYHDNKMVYWGARMRASQRPLAT